MAYGQRALVVGRQRFQGTIADRERHLSEFGKLPVSQVTSEMVLIPLRKIERRGAIETAKRLSGYILCVLKRTRGEGLVTTETIVSVEIVADALKRSPPGIKQPALTRVPQLIEFQT
jgi:hypothetical protein